jgi:hypothetical protein
MEARESRTGLGAEQTFAAKAAGARLTFLRVN